MGEGLTRHMGRRLQFGLQLASSLAPQRLAHPLACVLHLERGHVGVSLRRRHPGMPKNLLHDADVQALFDQQSRSGVPGIVHPGVSLDLRRSGAGRISDRYNL
jgi:hypothetical protein